MDITFDPTATRANTANTLLLFVEGPIAFLIGIIVLVPFLLEEVLTHNALDLGIAAGILLMTFFILRSFIAQKLLNDEEPPLSRRNAAEMLSERILVKFPNEGSTTFALLDAVTQTDRGTFILNEMGLPRQRLLDIAKPVLADEVILPFIETAQKCMDRFNIARIDEGCVLYALFARPGVFEDLLNVLDLSIEDLSMIIRWEQFHHIVWTHASVWSPEGLLHAFGGLGRHWVSGYNDALDAITINISDTILYRGKRKVSIHLDKIKDALLILGRASRHNIIVIGQDGSGKRTFIDNIAYHLRITELKAGSSYTNVLLLNAQDLLSGAHDPDAFLLQALKRADKQGRYILIIENIGLFLTAGDAKVRSVLGKFLQAKHISVIGIAENKDYHTLIKPDGALDAQFEKIMLDPTNASDTMSVLMEEYFKIEDKKHMHVTYKALKEIVDYADRYIAKSAFPGKAIDLLQDTVENARSQHDDYVTPEDVRAMVSLRAHMNVGEAGQEEKDVLQNLGDVMHRSIVGQSYAVDTIVNALKRARANIGTGKRPLGTFLFLGPTGVGKTETAKALASAYFGTVTGTGTAAEPPLIRLDMNEFGSPDSVTAIVGSSDPGHRAEGFLTQKVQDRPFSLVLLDEIEKADKKVLNLFLQILDEGYLTDSQGIRTDFRNTIIIATSNAGAKFIREFLSKNPDPDKGDFKKALLDEVISAGVYSPEFMNRFDDIILYFPLDKAETIEVASRMVKSVIANLEQQRGIAIRIDDDAVAAIAEKGYSPEFGVREMRRVVTDRLENYVAETLLNGNLKRGDIMPIRRTDLKL